MLRNLFLILIFFTLISSLCHASEEEILFVRNLISQFKNSFSFEHFRCIYQIRVGEVNSVKDAENGVPNENIRTVTIKWLLNDKKELITADFNDIVENKTSSYDPSISLFEEGCYLSDGTYTFVIHSEIPHGTITFSDEPRYLVKYYDQNHSLLTSFVSPEFWKDVAGYFDEKKLEQEALQSNYEKIDLVISNNDSIVTVQKIAFSENTHNCIEEVKYNLNNFFPCSSVSFRPISPSYFYITDFYKCSNNRLFPKRLVYAFPHNFPNDKSNNNDKKQEKQLLVYEYIVSLFDPDTPIEDDEFFIEVPKGYGITDGLEGSTYIYPEYWDIGNTIDISKLDQLYQLIKSETIKNKLVGSHANKSDNYFSIRIIFIILGVLFLFIGIYGYKKNKNR
jgi:hypothetical protein